MELVAELEPVTSMEEVADRVKSLIELYDWIDIPDAPLGYPSINSLLASCAISSKITDRVIAHIRLIDINIVAFKSIIKTVSLTPIRRIVFLRGDPPRKESSIVRDIEPEEALRYAKKKLPQREFGLIVSLRKPWSEVRKRLSINPDFILILNWKKASSSLLYNTLNWAKARGIKQYAYIVVKTPKNIHLLESTVNETSLFHPSEIEGYMSKLADSINGFIISVPGDFKYLLGLGRSLKDIVKKHG